MGFNQLNPFFVVLLHSIINNKFRLMLSADNARKALQLIFYPNNIKVGNPQPFSQGYDNYTGGSAALSNFNSMMQSNQNYPITGIFGHPGVPPQVGNLHSTYPTYGATWTGMDFVISGGGLTRTWTGTAVNPNDITIVIEVATLLFTGTLVNGVGVVIGTIAGQAAVNGGIASVVSGTLTLLSFKQIFYGKISWGMTNDNLGTVNQQILVNSYKDIVGSDYSVTLNATQTTSTDPATKPFDSYQGEITGTASTIYMAGKGNIYFDGYLFPIRTN